MYIILGFLFYKILFKLNSTKFCLVFIMYFLYSIIYISRNAICIYLFILFFLNLSSSKNSKNPWSMKHYWRSKSE